jgi:peptide/nickel transport system substrate-binding protein
MIVPAHYHAEVGEEAYKSAPIGTGPYKLKSWDAAAFTEIERFDDCFLGAPNIDIIRENIVPEASVRAVALETGEADSAVWPLVTEDNIRFRDNAEYTTFVTSSVAINHFPMNNEHPALSDKAVRKAMMNAIDRDSIVNDLWQGLAVKATANLSPALEFYYNPDVTTYDYDPDLAMTLLDEAGWVPGADGIREKDGVRLAWTCTIITGDQARGPEAVAVQEWLAQVGMEMSIAEAPVASIQEGQRAGTVDMSLYNWTYGGGSGEPDGSTTLRSDARNNWSLWKNARVDELLDLGLTQTNPDDRKVTYDEIQAIVAEEVPFLFIKYWDWFNIFTPRVKGLPESILAGNTIYRYSYKWWLDDAS